MEESTSRPSATAKKMDFFQGSPNAFQQSTSLPYNMPPPYVNGANNFVPVNSNTNFATLSPPQQWQAPPLENNNQMWTHTVPNVMPWSSNGPCTFSQPFQQPFEHPVLPNIPPQNVAYFPSATFPQPPFMPSQSMPISPLPGSPAEFTPLSTSPPFQGNFNQNNKRQVSPLDTDVDANFDFESRRPVKKYISEDKVLEIFDQFGRFHIREGEQYIVEDEPLRKTSDNSFKHNVKIEVLEDEDEHVLELSPELKNAFQNGNPSIAGKLMQEEKDKISKAVVLWQPNTILKTLLSDDDSKSESEDDANGGVEIEEIFSDLDEEMLNCESEIEPITEEDNFELME